MHDSSNNIILLQEDRRERLCHLKKYTSKDLVGYALNLTETSWVFHGFVGNHGFIVWISKTEYVKTIVLE